MDRKGKVPHKIKYFMWLLTNNAVLTRDNMVKRNWSRNPACQFCNLDESCDHQFFTCPIAKVVWAAVAKSIGASNIPDSLSQCWARCDYWLHHGRKCHLWGISAICWSIWKARNRACFDRKIIRNLIEKFYQATALMRFWTGVCIY